MWLLVVEILHEINLHKWLGNFKKFSECLDFLLRRFMKYRFFWQSIRIIHNNGITKHAAVITQKYYCATVAYAATGYKNMIYAFGRHFGHMHRHMYRLYSKVYLLLIFFFVSLSLNRKVFAHVCTLPRTFAVESYLFLTRKICLDTTFWNMLKQPSLADNWRNYFVLAF